MSYLCLHNCEQEKESISTLIIMVFTINRKNLGSFTKELQFYLLINKNFKNY